MDGIELNRERNNGGTPRTEGENHTLLQGAQNQAMDAKEEGTPNGQTQEESNSEKSREEIENEEKQKLGRITLEELRNKRRDLEEKLKDQKKNLEEQEKKIKEQENQKKKIEARMKWLEQQQENTETVQESKGANQKRKGKSQGSRKEEIEEEKRKLQGELEELQIEADMLEKGRIDLENRKTKQDMTRICSEINQRSPYIIQNLNLLYPKIYEQVNVTQNFRMFGLNEPIVMKKEVGDTYAKRKYNQEGENGFSSFMRILFPSPSGELSILSMEKGVQNLEKDCVVTPQLLAKIAVFIYDYRKKKEQKREDVEKIKGEIDEIIDCFRSVSEGSKHDQELTDKFKDLGTYLLYKKKYEDHSKEFQDNLETQQIFSLNKENFLSLVKGDKGKEIQKNLQFFWRLGLMIQNPEAQIKEENFAKFTLAAYKKNSEVLKKMEEKCGKREMEIKVLEKISKFFATYLYDEPFLKHKVTAADLYGANTIMHLLKSAIQAIDTQEVDDSAEEKYIPKYMVEKMLMGYFVKKFLQQSDIDAFNNEIAKWIQFEDGDQMQSDENKKQVKQEWEEVNGVMDLLTFSKLSPYKDSGIIADGRARAIGKRHSEQNIPLFEKQEDFSDCADTAIRHVINLLGYSVSRNWDIFFDKEDSELKTKLDIIKNAMQQGGEAIRYSLKERLQLFFYHQCQEGVGANAGDQETRTLWEYVISNMDENLEEGMYKIKYVEGKKYELETGMINALKLIYNIAVALKTKEEDDYKQVAKKIKLLERAFQEKKDVNECIKEASQATFRLINPKVIVSKVNVFQKPYEGGEILGEIEAKIFETIDGQMESSEFSISQSEDHATTSHNPIKVKEKLKDKNFKSEFSKLLAIKYFDERAMKKTLDKFNKLYGGILTDEQEFGKPPEVWNTYRALKALKEMQGLEEDYEALQRLLRFNKSWRTSSLSIKLFQEVEERMPGAPEKVIKRVMEEGIQPMKQYIFENYIQSGTLMRSFFQKGQKKRLEENDCEDLEENLQDFFVECPDLANKFYISDGLICKKGAGGEVVGIGGTSDRVTIPKEVTEIANYAFRDDQVLGTIKFEAGSNLRRIGKAAFYGCKNLWEINNLPDSLKVVAEEAFKESSLGALAIPAGIEKIEQNTFKNSELAWIEFCDNAQLREIGTAAFEECTSLMEIIIPITVREIGQRAFRYCGGLNKVEIKEGSILEEIEAEAFSNCWCLPSIRIPKGVKKIGAKAFQSCDSLRELIIEDVDAIEEIGDGAFAGCHNLENLPQKWIEKNPRIMEMDEGVEYV